MKFSEQWLREWVNPGIDTDELAQLITMAGMEVDAVEPVAGDFSGVVVAEIVSAEQHPDADKLRVCQVNTGSDTVQIVCGAPNARAGLKAPLAQVGAVLPGDFKIKKAKLRGVESQGMLCAGAELELNEESDGLMELASDAPVGADLREYLDLSDKVIELDLTPNRADCLGLSGVAREVALLTESPLADAPVTDVAATIEDTFPVSLEAGIGCPRFVNRVIRGIDISRPSPLWMQEKLRRSGIRSIDPVVDVTNYVMLELGQPMHAFDLAKLSGGIVVRMAKAGEALELLNGQTIEMRDDTMVVADQEKAVSLAGIMGGQSTAVSEATTDLMLEAAWWQPLAMAGQARGYGLHTDASHRFERGADFAMQVKVIERATELILAICGGEAGPTVDTRLDEHMPERPPVRLRRERIPRMLGFDMPDAEVERILTGLGLGVSAADEGWEATVPSWRVDIAIEADLLEELARVYGYNNLPVSHIHADLVMPARPERDLSIRKVRRLLTGRDYQEAVTYSFVDAESQAAFDPDLAPVELQNPISADLAVMRTSLMPGLVRALAHNTARQQHRVRLFETGLRFLPGTDGLEQRPTLAALITGRRQPESWTESGDLVDFYDLKGDLESLLDLTAAPGRFVFRAGERTGLHPGQTAILEREGRAVGVIGTLHPQLQAKFDLAQPVYLFEVDLAVLLDAALPAFKELSRYPEVRRDLALLVDKSVSAGELLANVREAAGTYLTDLRLFDVYEGKGIDPKRKSLALGLTFRDSSRTLSDQDVNKSVDQVIDLLIKTYNAELRS
ncbi:MAG: phenylalanine--tRNA ligase subunit beta [Halieaceae bacterium]|jgi:phenylalanyl-tRNA synthetase beta chain|nr:phenylalanine--tRNA ligase subunit beta [Halieaceae bacterium]